MADEDGSEQIENLSGPGDAPVSKHRSKGRPGIIKAKPPKSGGFLNFKSKSPTNFLLIMLAVGMVVGGLTISSLIPKHPEIQSLLDECMKPTGLVKQSDGPVGDRQEAGQLIAAGADPCKVAVYQFDKAEHAQSSLQILPLVGDVLLAIGLALGVALIVSRTVEAASRRDLETALDEKTRELSEAVMKGMFNRRHPEKLLDLVSEHILQKELIREKLSLNYVFTRWEPDGGGHPERLEGKRFIAVKATINFTVRNVTASDAGDGKAADVPICLILPNPIFDELKSSVGVEEVVVDGQRENKGAIDNVNQQIQEQLKDDQLTDVRADFGSKRVQAGQSLQVQMVYTMIKELEDSELFRTLQISKGLDVVVFDNTNYNLKLRAKPVGFAGMTELASHETTRHWQIDDILLPHQGILVWWKQKAPSLPAPKPPANETTKP